MIHQEPKIEDFLSQNPIEEIKILDSPLSNKLTKGFSLNFLGSDKLFRKINSILNNYLNKYDNLENDSGLRFVYGEQNDIQKVQSDFKDNLKTLLENMGKDIYQIINDEEDFIHLKDITKENRVDLISDFISHYSKRNGSSSEFKNFLHYLYDKLYDNFENNIHSKYDEINIYEYISYCILFTYSKKDFISFIENNSKNACDLAEINEIDLFQNIKNNIEKDEIIQFIEDNNNPNVKKIINETIYLLNDSFLFSILKLVKKITKDKIKQYFQLLLAIYNDAYKFEMDFNLYGTQIFQIKSTIDLFEFVEKNDDFGEKMEEYINFGEQELTLFKKQEINELTELIEKEFKFLNSFSKNEKFYEYIIDIFIRKYKSFVNNNIQDKIIENILLNLDFLKNSFDFFFSIFDNFDYSEEILENYSEKLEKISNLELPQINKKVLDIILLNIFTEIIMKNNSEYFENGFPNNEFFTKNYEKFESYMEDLIIDQNYKNRQNSKFVEIYFISFIKIFIFYISKIYANKQLYEEYNGLTDIHFISFISNDQRMKPFEIFFIKCIKYHKNNSFSSFSMNDLDELDEIKEKYFNNVQNDYFYHPLEIICIDDYENYIKLRELFNNVENANFQDTDIAQQMTNIKGSNDEVFFFEFMLNEILCSSFNKYTSENFTDKKNDIVNWCLNSFTNNNIKEILESIYNFENQMNNFSDKETTLIIFCFIFYIISQNQKKTILKNRDKEILKNINRKKKKSLIKILTEILALFITFTDSFIQKNYHNCMNEIQNLKKIVLEGEKIMNNFYDKSDIFTLLNLLKKSFIENKNENYERIIETLIENLDDDKYMEENKKLILNYCKYTELNKTIRIILNEFEKDENSIYEEFLFIQEVTSSSKIYEDIVKTKESSLITFYLGLTENLLKINEIVKNINPILAKINEEYNGRITKKKIEGITLNDLLNKDKNKIKDFIRNYKSLTYKNIKEFDKIKCLIISENEESEIRILYKNMISLYNDILSGFQSFLKKHDLKQSNKKINLQLAKDFQILQPISQNKEKIENCIQKNTKHFVKINKITGLINYNNFNNIEYNVIGIEKDILKNFVINKEKLEEKLIYFSYAFEINKKEGNLQNIIDTFEKNNPQKEEISDQNKGDINNLIESLKEREIAFFGFIKKMITCVKDEENNDNENIYNMIKKYKDIMDSVDDNIKRYFDENKLKVTQLMSIFEYIEDSFFDNLSENIAQKYKNDIDQNNKKEVKKLLQSQKVISHDSFISLLKKFTIRFLFENDLIEEDTNCFELIQKNEGLYKEIINKKNENDFASLMVQLIDINLPVSQIISLIKVLSEREDNVQKKDNIQKKGRGRR